MIKRVSKTGSASQRWFSHQTDHPEAKVDLFCFVFAGGSPSFFAPIKTFFPEWINVLPVLYPGRELRAREAVPDQLETLVDDFLNDNASRLRRPYAIWGHCSGALIGFEIAHIASGRGFPPRAFMVSGCEAPQYSLQRLQSAGDFSKVSDEAILQDLLDFNLMGADMVNDLVFRRYFLPIYRADLNMLSTYHLDLKKTLPCPAAVLHGTEDRMVKEERNREWADRFAGQTRFLNYSGEHYFVNDHKPEVAQALASFIGEQL